MRPPADADIPAPEFPPTTEWVNVALLRIDRLLGRHAILVEFWDFARVNSLRTLPYLRGWHERYLEAGLQIIGVHSPGYSFGRDAEAVARAVERLGSLRGARPAARDLAAVRNRGWPGRYLFDRRGLLRYIHYGEGDYRDSEPRSRSACGSSTPRSLSSPWIRCGPRTSPGVLLEPQTADIALPGDRERLELVRDWEDGED